DLLFSQLVVDVGVHVAVTPQHQGSGDDQDHHEDQPDAAGQYVKHPATHRLTPSGNCWGRCFTHCWGRCFTAHGRCAPDLTRVEHRRARTNRTTPQRRYVVITLSRHATALTTGRSKRRPRAAAKARAATMRATHS